MAKKRMFRTKARIDADYPTLDDFDVGRRSFLLGLGGLIGAGALMGCRSRAAPSTADAISSDGPPNVTADGPPNMGGALPPPAQFDAGPDEMILDGEAPQPDSRVDQMQLSGAVAPPPAKIDGGCDDGGCPNP